MGRASTNNPARRLISVQAGADYLDVSTRSIRAWIAQGRITGYRVGRHVKVDLHQLEAFATPIPTAGDAA